MTVFTGLAGLRVRRAEMRLLRNRSASVVALLERRLIRLDRSATG